MEEEITTEINKIISYCRVRECGECKYHRFLQTEEICALHNPSAWEVYYEWNGWTRRYMGLWDRNKT